MLSCILKHLLYHPWTQSKSISLTNILPRHIFFSAPGLLLLLHLLILMLPLKLRSEMKTAAKVWSGEKSEIFCSRKVQPCKIGVILALAICLSQDILHYLCLCRSFHPSLSLADTDIGSTGVLAIWVRELDWSLGFYCLGNPKKKPSPEFPWQTTDIPGSTRHGSGVGESWDWMCDQNIHVLQYTPPEAQWVSVK